MRRFADSRSAMFSAFALIAYFLSAAQAQAVAIFSNITFQNGWASPPGDTRFPGVSIIDNIVHMKGALAGGAQALAFQLPPGFRPIENVHVRVDLCNGVAGQLLITPAGFGYVQTPSFASAQCRVSLENVAFARSATDFTALTLLNGWTGAALGGPPAGVRALGGIVHLRGAVTGGAAAAITTLPVALRPINNVYIPVTLCNASRGRLFVQPSGVVSIISADGQLATAQCMTSLDGASFALPGSGFEAVTLENGWAGGASSTDQPGVLDVGGVLHFRGAVSGGSAARIFTLPARLRPVAEIFVPVDLCNGGSGSLRIGPNGAVGINATGPFSNAQCFTSLESVSFALTVFTPLTLTNGWEPYSTRRMAVGRSGNVVTLTGQVTLGTSSAIATLPAGYRPPTNVYVPASLCSFETGRILIQPSGLVSVESPIDFAQAQCFTSLDGVSFVIPNASTQPLAPVNGWVGAVFGTNIARAQKGQGVVRLSGAIASGTGSTVFTLPAAFRPAANVYVPVTLCNANKGRLYIPTTGVVAVVSETTFAEAQCFTSLDGVSDQTSPSAAEPLTLINNWVAQPFVTFSPTVTDFGGVIRLSGAIRNGTSDIIAIMPPKFRPRVDVHVPVDLCVGKKGRLAIHANGNLRIVAGVSFSDAQCFTSLEGVAYAL